MAIATLAQRLRACDEASMSECPFLTEQVILEAADVLAEKDARIAALEAQIEDWRSRLATQCGKTLAAPSCEALDRAGEI